LFSDDIAALVQEIPLEKPDPLAVPVYKDQ
jgi:hypothetical protein